MQIILFLKRNNKIYKKASLKHFENARKVAATEMVKVPLAFWTLLAVAHHIYLSYLNSSILE